MSTMTKWLIKFDLQNSLLVGRGKRKKTEQLKEDVVSQKALDFLENNGKISLQRDADEVLGEYVTDELKEITD